ncbi:MAG: hypothetical protein ACI87N_003242 [Flavobacteriales bacterium]|jgi:hypothetical protein
MERKVKYDYEHHILFVLFFFLLQKFERYNIFLLLSVVDSKSTIEIAAFGRHSLYLQDPATLNDRFHISSNTKAILALWLLNMLKKAKNSLHILVQLGLITL